MSESHQHPVAVPPPAPFGGRRPNPERIITTLNNQLNDKANIIRRMEDEKAFLVSLADELTDENVALKAMVDQVTAENSVLREKLGLPQAGAIDLDAPEEMADLVTVDEDEQSG